MSFRTLLAINALIAVLMGAACVLASAQLIGSYGIALTPMGLVVYQFWGATLIGLGLLTWLARFIETRGTQRALAASLFAYHGLSCVIAVRGQYAGANDMGWSTVGLFLLLALAFGYFCLVGLRRAPVHSPLDTEPDPTRRTRAERP